MSNINNDWVIQLKNFLNKNKKVAEVYSEEMPSRRVSGSYGGYMDVNTIGLLYLYVYIPKGKTVECHQEFLMKLGAMLKSTARDTEGGSVEVRFVIFGDGIPTLSQAIKINWNTLLYQSLRNRINNYINSPNNTNASNENTIQQVNNLDVLSAPYLPQNSKFNVAVFIVNEAMTENIKNDELVSFLENTKYNKKILWVLNENDKLGTDASRLDELADKQNRIIKLPNN